MRARIHRGAHEIGGNCIELDHHGDRMVLDLGRPLAARWDDDVPLPDVAGLAEPDPSLHGLILSHGHLDHYGLAEQCHPGLPVLLGREAHRVLEAAAFFSPVSRPPRVTGHFGHDQRFPLGPFAVTPFLADHSAFDAYSLLVEAGGERLFYTGDIRGHGRKSRLFDELVASPPAADVLLMEGTHVTADGGAMSGASETDVEGQLVELLERTAGMVSVVSSAQNLDRLVTVFRATRRAGRTLVVDLYTATVAAATGRRTIPQPGFEGLRVHVPERQRRRVAASGEFDRVHRIHDIRLFPEDLATERGGLVHLGVSSTVPELVAAGALRDGAVVWSLWDGYLDEPSGRRLVQELEDADVPLHHIHASGHAHVTDLARLVDAFDPARVVPIHSEGPGRFGTLFPRVEPHPDGEWWEVAA